MAISVGLTAKSPPSKNVPKPLISIGGKRANQKNLKKNQNMKQKQLYKNRETRHSRCGHNSLRKLSFKVRLRLGPFEWQRRLCREGIGPFSVWRTVCPKKIDFRHFVVALRSDDKALRHSIQRVAEASLTENLQKLAFHRLIGVLCRVAIENVSYFVSGGRKKVGFEYLLGEREVHLLEVGDAEVRRGEAHCDDAACRGAADEVEKVCQVHCAVFRF